jgi:hypothetical protein
MSACRSDRSLISWTSAVAPGPAAPNAHAIAPQQQEAPRAVDAQHEPPGQRFLPIACAFTIGGAFLFGGRGTRKRFRQNRRSPGDAQRARHIRAVQQSKRTFKQRLSVIIKRRQVLPHI